MVGEKIVEVGGGEGGDLVDGDSAEVGEGGGGVGDEGGLIGLAAVGDRREEGSVGLDQDAAGGGGDGDLADGLGGGVGEVAGEGEMEAERERAGGLVQMPEKQCMMPDGGWPLGRRPVRVSRASRSSQASAGPNFCLAAGVASSDVRQWMRMGLPRAAAMSSWAMKAACWTSGMGLSRW